MIITLTYFLHIFKSAVMPVILRDNRRVFRVAVEALCMFISLEPHNNIICISLYTFILPFAACK